MDPAWPPDGIVGHLLAAAAIVAALAGLYRYVVRPISKAIATIAQIGVDWYGREGDPGHPRVPGVMERLVGIEQQIKVNGTGLPLGEAMAVVLKDVDALKGRASTNATGIARLVEGQAEAAQAAQAARDKAAEVHDELHTWVEEGQVREHAYLASLAELGIDLQPQPRRDPHTRTRRDDEPED